MVQENNSIILGVSIAGSTVLLIIVGLAIFCCKKHQTLQATNKKEKNSQSLSGQSRKNIESKTTDTITDDEQPFNCKHNATMNMDEANQQCCGHNSDNVIADNGSIKNQKPLKMRHILMEEPSGISITSQDSNLSQNTTLSNSPVDFGEPLPHIRKKQNTIGFKIRRALSNAFRALPANSYFYDSSIGHTTSQVQFHGDDATGSVLGNANNKKEASKPEMGKENDRCVNLQVNSPDTSPAQLGVITRKNSDNNVVTNKDGTNSSSLHSLAISNVLNRKKRNKQRRKLSSKFDCEALTGNSKNSTLFEDRETEIMVPKFVISNHNNNEDDSNDSNYCNDYMDNNNNNNDSNDKTVIESISATMIMDDCGKVDLNSVLLSPNISAITRLSMMQSNSRSSHDSEDTLGSNNDHANNHNAYDMDQDAYDDDDTSFSSSEEDVALGIKLVIQSPKKPNNNNNNHICGDTSNENNDLNDENIQTIKCENDIMVNDEMNQQTGGNVQTVAGGNNNNKNENEQKEVSISCDNEETREMLP